MKIPKTAKKAIENSKLMYELIYQEKLIDEQIKLNIFPSTINSKILMYWKAITNDTDWIINELSIYDKVENKMISIDMFKEKQRYFLTSLILHDKIVNNQKMKLDGKV